MEKNKGYTKQFKSDDPTTYLTDENQQKNMLLDMIDDEVEKKVKEKKIKKINKYVEPQIDESINKITERRVRFESLRNNITKAPPEIFKKNNSGLVGILGVSKRIKDLG
jgi:hypothetical protein